MDNLYKLHLLRAANLVLIDENRGFTTWRDLIRYYLPNFIIFTIISFSFAISLYLTHNHKDKYNNKLLYSANFILGGLFLLHLTYIDLIIGIANKHARLGRELLSKYRAGFLEDGNKFILFLNKEYGKKFCSNKSMTKFWIESAPDSDANLYPKTLQSSLRCLYSPPTSKAFCGKVAGATYLNDGTTTCAEDVVSECAELMSLKHYGLEFELYTREIKSKYSLSFVGSEIEILRQIYEAVNANYDDRFNEIGMPFLRENERIKTILLGETMTTKVGVCRHRAVLTFMLASYAVEDGLLSGKVIFRSTAPEIGIGHVWVEYKSNNDVYILDSMLKTFGLRQTVISSSFWGISNCYSHQPTEILNYSDPRLSKTI